MSLSVSAAMTRWWSVDVSLGIVGSGRVRVCRRVVDVLLDCLIHNPGDGIPVNVRGNGDPSSLELVGRCCWWWCSGCSGSLLSRMVVCFPWALDLIGSSGPGPGAFPFWWGRCVGMGCSRKSSYIGADTKKP